MSNSQKRLFRITHIDNIDHIARNGVTQIESSNANPHYRTIGDVTLINTRKDKWVSVVDTGANIRLGDYIPFYFGYRMPMLYVIQKGSNFVPDKVPPSEIVYCVTSVENLLDSDLEFYFSDGHATDNFTQFFSKSSISKINKLVDFEAVKAKYWKKDNDLDLKRRKQAELLVKDDIAPTMIAGYIVYNAASKAELNRLGIPEKKIVVKPEYYF